MRRLILSFTVVFFLVVVFSSCGGGGGGGGATATPSNDIIIATNSAPATNNSPLALAKYMHTNELVAVVGAKDTTGNVSGIDGFVYIAPNGQSTTITLGSGGLPSSLTDSNGTKGTFSNYTPNSVDVTFFDSSNNLLGGPTTVPIDNAMVSEYLQLLDLVAPASNRTLQTRSRSVSLRTATVSDGTCASGLISPLTIRMLKLAGLGISIGECGFGLAVMAETGGLASVVLLSPTGFACASAMTAALEGLPSVSKIVKVSNVVTFPKDMLACITEGWSGIGSCVNVVSLYADEFNNARPGCSETIPPGTIEYPLAIAPHTPDVFGINVIKTGDGSGTVTPSGNISASKFPVTLTATPDDQSTFMGWSCEGPYGSCSCPGTGSCTLPQAGNYIITARFAVKSQTCTYSISSTTGAFSSNGGGGSVTVSTSSGCGWTAASNASWITVTTGSSGNDNGTVLYTVDAYTGTSDRTGTMTIAGKTFIVTQTGDTLQTQKPNLTPYQPVGWSDKIMVYNGTGTPLLSTDTLYVNWAVVNNGLESPSNAFYVQLSIDGLATDIWQVTPPRPNPNYYVYITDFSIGSLSAGTHTIKIFADSTGTVDEIDETDNEYTTTITVTDPPPGEVTGIAFSGGVGGWGSFINVKITPDGLFGVSITCDWVGNAGSSATRTTTTLHSDATCSNSDVVSWPDSSITITATVTGTPMSVSIIF
jgi:hypothetical protein